MLAFIHTYLSTSSLLTIALVLCFVYNVTLKILANKRIAKLGARAPVRVTYFPYGLDMLYNVISHIIADKNYEMWTEMFARYGKGGYTVEAGIGERVILTAEPDNIKAILATQFKDFGKGEQFRKDWHPFLGNGRFYSMFTF